MKLESERTQDESYITNTWPSIDTYLFFKFEVRKNFGLSQLDKDFINTFRGLSLLYTNEHWFDPIVSPYTNDNLINILNFDAKHAIVINECHNISTTSSIWSENHTEIDL